MFLHPPWMVGIMLILGVLSLVVGLTLDPFWLVMGSPAILTLAVYVGVRIVLWRRAGRRHTLDTGTREPGPWNRPPPPPHEQTILDDADAEAEAEDEDGWRDTR